MTCPTTKQLLRAVRNLIPPLSETLHKGQAGRIGVLGGSEDYTGAPFYSSMSAHLFGADMAHVICEPGAGMVIKSYSPDLIVHPLMRQSTRQEETSTDKMVSEITSLLERLHVVVIGPGLGRDDLMQKTAAGVIKAAVDRNMGIVIDADGLYLIEKEPGLIMGYTNVVLTPNHVEFNRLCQAMGVSREMKEEEKCKELARSFGNITIVQKGTKDVISNGVEVYTCDVPGGLKRCGGQGDILGGILATLLAWKETHQRERTGTEDVRELMLCAFGACCTTRVCAHEAFKKHKRAMVSSDMVKEVGEAYQRLFELNLN
ncbi:ATP-dependent (S)-NAD(P)H-hydrate dehydratase [Neolecta irregularis DAH-3]|uniref:ATP-dependent (S)-NAD(P)H-hydrate dehydratase n=1 Tax=Neolecta irregularis (strain DAH-3) TaxID=1198029 RepID=A0A1U7LLF3_NEOID|nr:ATP-dependent (S)-NAD(P)H-hydrate dehydratase [Neolecta irregularis DAH-3]|eukprot:OLL23484.1 ATP-dependent (S)-NAD(P)H-hydrate dehydratase [Neolecta irregularis DAH-3]